MNCEIIQVENGFKIIATKNDTVTRESPVFTNMLDAIRVGESWITSVKRICQ